MEDLCKLIFTNVWEIDLDSVMVNVLAIGPNVHGFKSEDGGLLRSIKFRSTTTFGGEMKSTAPCRKMLRHVTDSAEYDGDTT
jgi:hypothetical protein